MSEAVTSEASLARLAIALGADRFGGPLSRQEQALITAALAEGPLPRAADVAAAKMMIRAGGDPLGKAFLALRRPEERRADGAVYTPADLIAPMVEWALAQTPQRVVDAGTGSGRFLAEVLRRSPETIAVAVDLDPLATLMARGTIAALEARSVQVKQCDYTRLRLPAIQGRTAFIGNPPYVRHHQLTPQVKAWAQTAAGKLHMKVSGLAGLHAYFFLATASIGRPGDVGTFVTSSEWLDVNYGAIIRNLLLADLGGESLHVVAPEAMPFEGTATTAVITNFRLGEQPAALRIRPVEQLADLGDLATEGEPVARERLAEAPRWSSFVRTRNQIPEGYIELGELCRVHRGTVTGSNATWVTQDGKHLPPSVLFAAVTKARELFAAGSALTDAAALRRVIDIPADLDVFDSDERKIIDRFLREAKRASVHKGYIAAHRRAWWSVGLRNPAPILATYMARRPPAFVINKVEARHINIAHGLYPRENLPTHALVRLAQSLRESISLAQGRTYAGGLTKFEPKEMERLPVPDLGTLLSHEPFPAPMVR